VLVPFRWAKGGEYGYGPGGTVRMVLAVEWVPQVHAEYRLGIDGLSYLFVVLTTLLTTVSILWAGRAGSSPRLYAMMLLFECAALGTFVAFDLLLLFLFSALMLLPATWLAGAGEAARPRSSPPRLFAYLLAGLVCLLVTMLGEYAVSRQVLGGTFDLVRLASAPMHRQFTTPQLTSAERTLFALAMVAFLVRLPIVPLHSWLVGLISDAPPVHSLMLVALVPATGVYGILRIAYPLFPAAGASLWGVFAVLALVSIFYCGLCALGQDDLRRTVAYAGISMSGFALLGASAMNPAAAAAAVYVSLFVALALSMLLLLCGAVDARIGSSNGTRAADVIRGAPFHAGFWVLAWFVWLVTPGLLAQALVVLGIGEPYAGISKPRSYAIACAACVAVLLTGAYVIAAARRIFSAPSLADVPAPKDLSPLETLEIALLGTVLIGLGIVPGALCFTFTRPALEALFRSLPL
jgi:NADH-quinone oxidoreductase subunit M